MWNHKVYYAAPTSGQKRQVRLMNPEDPNPKTPRSPTQHAKYFTPDETSTSSLYADRQDLRNDQIDTDQGGSDAPFT